MLRWLGYILCGFGGALAWLPLAFFVGAPRSSLSWLGTLTFGPAHYIRFHVAPGAPAWLFGRDSPGSHLHFLLLFTLVLWTAVFTAVAFAVATARRRLTRRSSERLMASRQERSPRLSSP